MSDLPIPEIKNKIINASTFRLAEEARQCYHVKLSAEFKRDDAFNPENWIQVISSGFRLEVGHLIEIVREDYAFYILTIIVAIDKHGLKLKELSFVQIEEEGEQLEKAEPTDGNLKIVWKGPHIKYAVLRSNGKELGKGFATKAEAQNFLENNK